MYVIKKKNSPYYVRSVELNKSFVIDIDYWTAKFTDVTDLIEAKFKLKKDAVQVATDLNKDAKYQNIKFEVVKI